LTHIHYTLHINDNNKTPEQQQQQQKENKKKATNGGPLRGLQAGKQQQNSR
jgi:hypothetical protein